MLQILSFFLRARFELCGEKFPEDYEIGIHSYEKVKRGKVFDDDAYSEAEQRRDRESASIPKLNVCRKYVLLRDCLVYGFKLNVKFLILTQIVELLPIVSQLSFDTADWFYQTYVSGKLEKLLTWKERAYDVIKDLCCCSTPRFNQNIYREIFSVIDDIKDDKFFNQCNQAIIEALSGVSF